MFLLYSCAVRAARFGLVVLLLGVKLAVVVSAVEQYVAKPEAAPSASIPPIHGRWRILHETATPQPTEGAGCLFPGSGCKMDMQGHLVRMIVHKPSKLAMCIIPKNGCTSFAKMFNGLNNASDRNIYEHRRSSHFQFGVTAADITLKNGWVLAVVLRDPIGRYISAFLSKCTAQPKNEEAYAVEADGRSCLGPTVGSRNATISDIIQTFEQHVANNFINGLPDNGHWLPQTQILRTRCGLTSLGDFSFIGNMDWPLYPQVLAMLNKARVPRAADVARRYFAKPRGHCTSCSLNQRAFLGNQLVLDMLTHMYIDDYEFMNALAPARTGAFTVTTTPRSSTNGGSGASRTSTAAETSTQSVLSIAAPGRLSVTSTVGNTMSDGATSVTSATEARNPTVTGTPRSSTTEGSGASVGGTSSARATADADGYIQHAAKGGREALLGPFRSSGTFDEALRGNMECFYVGDGEVSCAVTVAPSLQDSRGAMHAGASATLVDVLGTMALLARDPQRAGVGVEMSQTFLSPAAGGETVNASGRVVRYDQGLGFTEVKIVDGSGNILVTGRHTRAFPQEKI